MSQSAITPKRPRLRKRMVGCTLPPGALLLLDSLVGTFLGATRSEVLRFILLSWLTEHHTEVNQIGASRRAT